MEQLPRRTLHLELRRFPAAEDRHRSGAPGARRLGTRRRRWASSTATSLTELFLCDPRLEKRRSTPA
jgi:hypothetical protein